MIFYKEKYLKQVYFGRTLQDKPIHLQMSLNQ